MAQDKQTQQDSGETLSFIGGLMLGFIVSAPVAAWLSPRSGEQTRHGIRQRGLLIRRRAEQTLLKPIEQVQEKVGQIKGDSIEAALDEGKAIAAQHRAEKST